MSSAISSALVLLLFAALAAPAALASVGGAVGRGASGCYMLLAAGLLAYYASLPASALPETPALAAVPDGAVEGSPCERALAAAQRNRVVLDRSDADRLVVDREYWRMLPAHVRTALTDCANQVRGADGEGQTIEVVERAG